MNIIDHLRPHLSRLVMSSLLLSYPTFLCPILSCPALSYHPVSSLLFYSALLCPAIFATRTVYLAYNSFTQSRWLYVCHVFMPTFLPMNPRMSRPMIWDDKRPGIIVTLRWMLDSLELWYHQLILTHPIHCNSSHYLTLLLTPPLVITSAFRVIQRHWLS